MGVGVEGLSRAYELTRYADPHNILRSEAIYGDGFQSPGGIEGFRESLADRMPVRDGMALMDIGAGLGGAAFYLASRFAAEIVGIDIAPNIVALAKARQQANDPHERITFINGDIYSKALKRGYFDIIYSRDVLMYEPAKKSLFAQVHRLLKSGGRFCVTDFCTGRRTEDFEEYASVSNYYLCSVAEYASLLEDAGFSLEVREDISAVARRQLMNDLRRYQVRLAAGDLSIGQDDADHIVKRWERKIRFLEEGSLTQGVFVAAKVGRSAPQTVDTEDAQ